MIECAKKEVREAKAVGAARFLSLTEGMVRRKAVGNEKYAPLAEQFSHA